MFPMICIGYMGNNIYPARAGEVLRSVVLKRREDVPISASLATVVVERIFDGVVMLGFVFLNLPFIASQIGDAKTVGWIQSLALWGGIAFAVALTIFLLAAMYPQIAEKWINFFVDRLLPARWRGKIYPIVTRFLSGLQFDALAAGSADGLYHLGHHLAAGNLHLLVCDAGLLISASASSP